VASNYKYNGTDLDNIFAPIGSSSPGSNTGYTVGAQDLAARYYTSTGGDTPGYNVGYKVNGTDLGGIFRRWWRGRRWRRWCTWWWRRRSSLVCKVSSKTKLCY